MMTVTPPSLTYATSATDARVMYKRDGDGGTVVIHRPERRRKAAFDSATEGAGHLIVPLMLAGSYLFWGVGSAFPLWGKVLSLLLLIPAAFVILLPVMYVLAWVSSARLAKPIIIELTPAELIVRNLDGPPRNLKLKRDGLYAIYTVSHTDGIFVRRHGQELAAFSVTPDKVDAERIADFLRDVAGLGLVPPEAQVVDATEVGR
jgi:hypothetical protein